MAHALKGQAPDLQKTLKLMNKQQQLEAEGKLEAEPEIAWKVVDKGQDEDLNGTSSPFQECQMSTENQNFLFDFLIDFQSRFLAFFSLDSF